VRSLAEPNPDLFPYAGWVPTAGGRLSFRHIGQSQYPTPSIYANVSTPRRRLILAYQRRNLSDVPFQRIIHYLCNIRGDFWFVLFAHSVDDPHVSNELRGTIYVFKSKEDWRKESEQVVRSSIQQITEQTLLNPLLPEQHIRAELIPAQRAVKKAADIAVHFELSRTGEVYFRAPIFNNSDLEFASNDYAATTGHDFPHWVSTQCYFFLRDVCHRHQHHPPHVDNILVLQYRNPADPVVWRFNIIYSLYYYIVREKRFLDASSIFQASGVLGYAMSFRTICGEALGDLAIRMPRFDSEALLQSLQARANEETWRFRQAADRAARMGVFWIARA